jgi:hypothetical protein
MRKVMIALIAIVLVGCPTNSNNTGNIIIPPTDPAFWFGEIYDELITRVGEIDSDSYSGPTGEGMGQIANCQYVCNAINAKWGANTVAPAAGTATRVANCEYLLKMIDKANRNGTTFGASSYATKQVVDVIAVNTAVNRLWIPSAIFVAVGNNGNIGYSTDIINWTIKTVGSKRWLGIAYGNGKFVAVGEDSSMAYSTSGVNWTTQIIQLPNRPLTWHGVTYGNGKFVAVGNSGYIAYSTDGINWTTKEGSGLMWNGVTYGNGKFVAVGNISMAYSTDGINWTSQKVGSVDWFDVTYGGD